MIKAEEKITMLKYILATFHEAALQLSYSGFVKSNIEEAREEATRAKLLEEILDLLKSDDELKKVFAMAQTLAEMLGDKINLMTPIINNLKQEDEADV